MKSRYYAIENYTLKNGTQLARLHDYFSKVRIPAIQKATEGPVLMLEALIAPHMPQAACIAGLSSLDQLSAATARPGVEQWEQGPEPPFEAQSLTLVEAAPYSPELVIEKRKTPRVFEWRVYHSPTYTQLKALHERFSGPEIRIFHRTGVHPVLYSSTIAGPNMPNLTYLIPFDNLDAREKAWSAFASDPEWVKVRQDSIDKHGQISANMQISLWKAAPYSPVG
jgi:hypothetical protein